VIASTIGATTGDFLTKPDDLNLGYGVGSLILVTVLAVIFFIRSCADKACIGFEESYGSLYLL
jgi:uncharacterized membrane-anchored protein